MRDECTEPVVRENLELQERLVAVEQAKVDLEDRLSTTRSEVPASPTDLSARHPRDCLHYTVHWHSTSNAVDCALTA